MAAKKAANKAAKTNKDNSTILNAGKPKKDNSINGAKSVPAYKMYGTKKATAETFSSNKKMKKPN